MKILSKEDVQDIVLSQSEFHRKEIDRLSNADVSLLDRLHAEALAAGDADRVKRLQAAYSLRFHRARWGEFSR